MRFLRAASLGLGAVVAVAAAFVAGTSLHDRRLAPASPQPSLAAVGAARTSPWPSPTPARCDSLARLVPSVAPGLTRSAATAGTVRVASAEGGWSIDLPAPWYVQPVPDASEPEFGMARITSYDTTGRDFGGSIGPYMLPTSTGVEMRVEIWSNADSAPLDAVATEVSRQISTERMEITSSETVMLGSVASYRATLTGHPRSDPVMRPPVPAPMQRDLWLVPAADEGRVVVVYAWPRSNPLIAVAERAVQSLVVTAERHVQLPVLLTRDQVVHRWLYDPSGVAIAGRRAEAKLLTWAEANHVVGHWTQPRVGRIDRSPDELFWLVAVSGPDLPRMGIGGGRAEWMLYESPATLATGDPLGGQLGSGREWRSAFDAARDLCH